MKYVALLRGINVGGKRKVEMSKLKKLFEMCGYSNVLTYLNSGNVIFNSTETQENLQLTINGQLEKKFGFEIKTLVLSEADIQRIVDAIPGNWRNDSDQKTDVAFLFPEIDSKHTMELFPVKKEYVDMRYVSGAIFWNVSRKVYNKSHLNKIIRLKEYHFMTVRNVNTARYLAGIKA